MLSNRSPALGTHGWLDFGLNCEKVELTLLANDNLEFVSKLLNRSHRVFDRAREYGDAVDLQHVIGPPDEATECSEAGASARTGLMGKNGEVPNEKTKLWRCLRAQIRHD